MSMKPLLILLICITGFVAVSAKSARVLRPKTQVYSRLKSTSTLHKAPLVGKETWKPIVAAGAAGAALVASYKLSDGMEDGLRTAAKEDPKAFMGSVNWLVTPLILFAIVLGLFFLYKLTPIIKRLLQEPKG